MINKDYLRNPLPMALIIFSVAFYLFSFIRQMPYTEHYGDSAISASFAAEVLKHREFDTGSDVNIHFLGISFPTNMMTPYMFQLPSYLLAPVVLIDGLNLRSLNILSLLTGISYLILTVLLVKRFFGMPAAAVTAVLLSTDPSYLFYTSNVYISTEPFNNVIIAAVILLVSKKRSESSFTALSVSAFLLGLGLCVKLSFASRLAALMAAVVFIYTDELKELLIRMNTKRLVMLFGFFMLGTSLFTVYNFKTGLTTFKLLPLMDTSAATTAMGIDNRNILGNFKERLKQIKENYSERTSISVNRSYSADKLQIRISKLYMYIFFANLLAALLLFKKQKRLSRNIFALYIFYIIMFLFSLFTPHSLSSTQNSYLYPFPQLVIAVFFTLALNIRKSIAVAASIAVLMLLYSNLDFYFSNINMMKTAGKSSFSSFYVTELIKMTDSKFHKDIYAYDMDFIKIAKLISEKPDRYHLLDAKDGEFTDKSRKAIYYKKLRNILGREKSISIIVQADIPYHRERLNWVLSFARERGLKTYKKVLIKNARGYPVYLMYDIRP